MCQMFCLNLLSSYPNYNTEEQYMRIITGKARGLQLTVPKLSLIHISEPTRPY